MKKIFVVLAILVMSAAAQAAVINSWAFTGSVIVSQTAGTIDANLDTSGSLNIITRGAGAGTSAGASSFRTTGFQNNGISTANTDFFQIALSAASGYSLSLNSLSATMNGTTTYYAAPGVTDQWAYSLDGSTFNLIASTLQAQTALSRNWNFTGVSALQNVDAATTVTLRYYASGQTTTGGWGFSGSAGALTQLDGDVVAIPEPATMSLLGLGALAMVLRRKMKK